MKYLRRKYMMAKTFDWQLPTEIKFGSGKIEEAGEVCRRFGTKCLVVTTTPEPWLEVLVARVRAILASAGVESEWFAGVGINPTTDQITAGAVSARAFGAQVVLGLGGGSSMDGAKAIAVEATHPGTSWDYLFFRDTKPTSATLPVIAVSTTSGTGSQLTQVAVVTKTDERCKSAIYNDIVLPRVAIVDPELMTSVPPRMTAFTGFDAFTHAFETFIHPGCNPYIEMMAREAITLVLKWLPKAIANGQDTEARYYMALADSLAGLCIRGAGVTLPHGMGMAIGGMYPHVAHGQSLAIVYPAFMEYTQAAAPRQFAWLARQLDPSATSLDDAKAAAMAPALLAQFIKEIGISQKLRDVAVPEKELDALTAACMVLPDYKNNPRVATPEEMSALVYASW
jgi:alcohol dehydrogenase class IV